MRNRWIYICLMWIWACGLVLLVAGCGNTNPLTVAPHPVVSHYASPDANNFNSGIISADQNGFIVTPHFLDRHGFNSAQPGVIGIVMSGKEISGYRITAELMARAVEIDQRKKNEDGP